MQLKRPRKVKEVDQQIAELERQVKDVRSRQDKHAAYQPGNEIIAKRSGREQALRAAFQQSPRRNGDAKRSSHQLSQSSSRRLIQTKLCSTACCSAQKRMT